jgi:hypothetical protein
MKHIELKLGLFLLGCFAVTIAYVTFFMGNGTDAFNTLIASEVMAALGVTLIILGKRRIA